MSPHIEYVYVAKVVIRREIIMSLTVHKTIPLSFIEYIKGYSGHCVHNLDLVACR